jgi:protein-tyrosine-phosphatase
VTRLDQPRPPVTVLLVCTGNVCRSPLAEQLGRSVLEGVLGGRAATVRLHSAGTRAVEGSGMHPDSARALQRYGVDAGDFRARQLHETMTAEADLILTMTERHRQEVLERAPRALGRTFTLREAADLLRRVDGGTAPVGDTVPDRVRNWVRQLAAARSRRPVDRADDVRDPIGGTFDAHEEAATAIAAALVPVLRQLSALVRGDAATAAVPRSTASP